MSVNVPQNEIACCLQWNEGDGLSNTTWKSKRSSPSCKCHAQSSDRVSSRLFASLLFGRLVALYLSGVSIFCLSSCLLSSSHIVLSSSLLRCGMTTRPLFYVRITFYHFSGDVSLHYFLQPKRESKMKSFDHSNQTSLTNWQLIFNSRTIFVAWLKPTNEIKLITCSMAVNHTD